MTVPLRLVVPVALTLALLVAAADAQPVGSATDLPVVVFDDFTYDPAEWADDRGLDSLFNAGSLFGWNVWERSLDGSRAPYTDRLWYRGFAWTEPPLERSDLIQAVPGAQAAGIEHGGLLLMAAAGYAGNEGGRADPEVNSGFAARHGTWAASINFSDLDDVRGLMQSFWTIGHYVAIVPGQNGGLKKAWSEVDHEFNNWFHTLWTRDPDRGPTLGEQYLSDRGSVFVATGYLEGGHSQVVPLRAPAVPDAEELADEQCALFRNEAEAYRLSPASCARLIAGAHPTMVYGLPVLDRDITVDLLIRHDEAALMFELQAAWQAATPDGTGTDTYRLLMASKPYTPAAAEPFPSQPMTARFSQYVTRGAHGTEFGDRPLMRDHPMVVDWFYYSPDATLDLDAVAAHVGEIRSRGVRRLNTLGGPLHRPYTEPGGIAEWPHMKAEHDAAVFLEGPAEAEAGAKAVFLGHYADRQSELRLVWRTRRRDRAGAFSDWATVAEDAWFRHSVAFPEAGTPAFEVQLQAGEYPVWGDWTQPPEAYVSRTLTYAWDRSARRFRLAGSR